MEWILSVLWLCPRCWRKVGSAVFAAGVLCLVLIAVRAKLQMQASSSLFMNAVVTGLEGIWYWLPSSWWSALLLLLASLAGLIIAILAQRMVRQMGG